MQIHPEVFQNSLVLTGPTGAGKSALAIELAEKLNAEIISMDSMALYRGMDIGTAKPTLAERSRIAHHLIDVLAPWESSTVAWWLEQAANCTQDIQARGKTALFVGGTPLYLKAMLFGLFSGPSSDAEVRRRLEREAQKMGREHLHRRLQEVDPAAAARLHPNDLRRVVRALEVWELTGTPLSQWQRQWCREQPKDGPDCVWLDISRTELYDRINRRVDQMFAAGLVDEVESLRRLPHPLSREARQALGYKEVLEYLEGRASLAETIEQVKTRSRQFAKRQITWFRHLPGCRRISTHLTSEWWRSKMN